VYLLGDAAWWLPKWLDRLLPNVDIEGERLTALRVPDDAREVEDETQPVA
jgi:RND superfamily putative drug exporter